MLDKFQITPFSIIDTRSKEWHTRRNWWINKYNIQSELGREDTNSSVSLWNDNSVSVFDAALCELMYTWFLPEFGGSVLDPFAGGSVRGVVSEELGNKYTGIDISKKQILANRQQSNKPNWLIGNSDDLLDELNQEYDMVFTCPPYHDLEVYTNIEGDISNISSYESFIEIYKSILTKSASKLKNNRFFVIVVSEIRELTKTRNYKIGKYKGFVKDTIDILESANLHFYNDLILYNSNMNASRVSKTYFERNRKIPSVHQNVLVFIKGNPDIATEEFKESKPICVIDKIEYKSFRHAAISIDPDNLIASVVEKNCNNRKFKYRNWNIIGSIKTPKIKINIDGCLFESISHAVDVLGIEEGVVKKRIYSRTPEWRHWKEISILNNLSYIEVEKTWSKSPRNEITSISCEGVEFINNLDAAAYFKITPTRINQKIRSEKYPLYFNIVK